MRGNDQHAAEVARGISSLDSRLNQLAHALKDLITCETLATETRTFDANGITTFGWNFAFASVAVTSQSAQKVTITNMGPASAAPTSGPGVALLAPNKGATYNLAGTMLTLYGNPGDQVTVSVFARPQPPAWG
jgi:hypothetical protein